MKILSTTLLISFMTVFATSANAATNDSGDQAAPPKPRLATSKDLINAGYRRGFADAEAIALENTPAGSSSVTTPLSYRKNANVYVQAPTTKPRITNVKTPAAAPLSAPVPRKLPSYVQRMTPKVQPTVPNMQPKHSRAQPTQQQIRHAGHGHSTQAQIVDCELTDSLNFAARPITTVISTKKHYQASTPAKVQPKPVAHRAPAKVQHKPVVHRMPARKPAPFKRVANLKHNDHYHHTHTERADCELTDSLNRNAGPATRVISRTPQTNYSPAKKQGKKTFAHGNHMHHSETERADCALTDALNRGGSIVRVVHKH